MPVFHQLYHCYIWDVAIGFSRQWNNNSWSCKELFPDSFLGMQSISVSPSWLVAQRDCGNGQSEGKSSLCFAASTQTFPFCHWEEQENKGSHIFLLRANAATPRLEGLKWTPGLFYVGITVSSVGMSGDTIILCWRLWLLGHCDFNSPFQPCKVHRDVGCLSNCAIKNCLVVPLCSPSPSTAAGLGWSSNPASPALILSLPEQICALSMT